MKITKFLPWLIFAIILITDQALKWFIIKNQSGLVLDNDRLFFGFVGNNVIALTTSILALVGFWLIVFRKDSNYLALSLIFGGAFSNIVDRIFRGGVVDYLNVLYWSINLADIAIVAGIVWYGYSLFASKK